MWAKYDSLGRPPAHPPHFPKNKNNHSACSNSSSFFSRTASVTIKCTAWGGDFHCSRRDQANPHVWMKKLNYTISPKCWLNKLNTLELSFRWILRSDILFRDDPESFLGCLHEGRHPYGVTPPFWRGSFGWFVHSGRLNVNTAWIAMRQSNQWNNLFGAVMGCWWYLKYPSPKSCPCKLNSCKIQSLSEPFIRRNKINSSDKNVFGGLEFSVSLVIHIELLCLQFASNSRKIHDPHISPTHQRRP